MTTSPAPPGVDPGARSSDAAPNAYAATTAANQLDDVGGHPAPTPNTTGSSPSGGGSASDPDKSPGLGDADQDGLTDSFESQIGTDPLNPDSDHDRLTDSFETIAGTNPRLMDTDHDGLTDGAEAQFGLDPLNPIAAPPAVTPQPVPAPSPTAPAVTVIVVTPPAPNGTAATSAPETSEHDTTTSTDSTTPTSHDADAAATGSVQHMLDKALAQLGDQYVYGANVSEDDPDPQTWDCAELTQWAAHQAGADIPGSSFEQYLDLKAKGLLIPVDEAMRTPGTLLFHFSDEPQPGGGRPDEAHVAMSLGDGETVEAQSEETGVIKDEAAGRFEYAARLPGVDYENQNVSTVDPASDGPVAPDATTPDASGVTLDQVVEGIKLQESGGDYTADNPTSTASGAYQYIDGTWDGYGGYSHAGDAPPDVQDAKMRADTQAAYDRLGDWERVIASHFAGEGEQEGPKSDWDKVPGYDYNQNPSIQDYVDGVMRHIREADPSVTAASATTNRDDSTPTSDTDAFPEVATGHDAHSDDDPHGGATGSSYTIVNVTVAAAGTPTNVAVIQPGTGGAQPDSAGLIATLQQQGVIPSSAGQGPSTQSPSVNGQQGPTAGQPPGPSQPPVTTPGFEIDPGVDISDLNADSDDDGLSNRFEAKIGTNPTDADTDGDGLNDGIESTIFTDPLHVDSDGDGFIDGTEVHFGMNPMSPDLKAPFDADDNQPETPDPGVHDPLIDGGDHLP